MNIYLVFALILGFLVIAVIVTGLLAFIDWRAVIVRRFGHDYKKGLAHILYKGTWVYRESTLVFEGDDAMSYLRETIIDGEKRYIADIVPNEIGFSYDEYTGARIYRVRPGGCIGYSDDGEAPDVDYPAELIAPHVLDRSVTNYALSINVKGGGFNWKLIIYGFIAGIIIVAAVFYTGILKPPTTAQEPAQPPTEQSQPPPTINPAGQK